MENGSGAPNTDHLRQQRTTSQVVCFRAAGHQDLFARVDSSTTLSTIAHHFRKHRKIPREKKIFFAFRGHDLDQNTEILAMGLPWNAAVEVHLVDRDSLSSEQDQKETRQEVRCKAAGYADVVFIVEPEMTIRKITRSFRKRRDVPDEKTISITFNGQTLDENLKFGDADLPPNAVLQALIIDPQPTVPEPDQNQRVHVIYCKCDGSYKDIKLVVNREMTFATIAGHFRNIRHVPHRKTITFSFKGRVLDETTQIGEADIPEKCILDLQVRDPGARASTSVNLEEAHGVRTESPTVTQTSSVHRRDGNTHFENVQSRIPLDPEGSKLAANKIITPSTSLTVESSHQREHMRSPPRRESVGSFRLPIKPTSPVLRLYPQEMRDSLLEGIAALCVGFNAQNHERVKGIFAELCAQDKAARRCAIKLGRAHRRALERLEARRTK